MINVIGFSEFRPSGLRDDISNYIALRHKTDVFQISSAESISEIYDYFKTDPLIYIQQTRHIPHVWGDSENINVVAYDQIDYVWLPTNIPDGDIVLHWHLYQCDEFGRNTSPIADITTPLKY
jgi:hypothetical protein